MDTPPITPARPGDRLWFYVEEWRPQEETWYESLCGAAPNGWTEVFSWPERVGGSATLHAAYHWYSRGDGGMHETARSKWIAFRRPGDHQSYDAHVTAWRVESTPA